MKNHFTPVFVVDVLPQLSLEEEAIFLGEMAEEMCDADVALDDNLRLSQTHAGITATQDIGVEIVEKTATDIKLVDAVANMSVAGTDADPEAMIATDSATVSTEGFVNAAVEKLKKIWETIKAVILKAWKSITKFFSAIHLFLSPTKRRLKKLDELKARREQENKDEAERNKKNAAIYEEMEQKWQKEHDDRINRITFEFKGNISNLSNGSSDRPYLVRPTNLATALGDMLDTTQLVVERFPSGIVKLGKVIADSSSYIFQRDPESDGAFTFVNNFQVERNKFVHKLGLAINYFMPNASKQLGGVHLVANFDPEIKGVFNAGREIAHLTRTKFTVEQYRPKVSNERIPVLDAVSSDKVQAVVSKWLASVEEHGWTKQTADMEQMQDQLNKLAEIALQRRDDLKARDSEVSKWNARYAHDYMEICNHYATWGVSLIKLVNAATEVVNTVLDYATASATHVLDNPYVK